jgi:hypothetical protein
MLRLTKGEQDEVLTNCDHLQQLKFSYNVPLAFTEHGALMAANVLNSPTAVAMSEGEPGSGNYFIFRRTETVRIITPTTP